MKEILALLLKTLGLGVIIIVGGSACLWIPYIVSNCTDVGDVAYFVIIFASLIVSCVAVIFAQLKLDSLWSN